MCRQVSPDNSGGLLRSGAFFGASEHKITFLLGATKSICIASAHHPNITWSTVCDRWLPSLHSSTHWPRISMNKVTLCTSVRKPSSVRKPYSSQREYASAKHLRRRRIAKRSNYSRILNSSTRRQAICCSRY